MALLAYNKTTNPVTLAASKTPVTLHPKTGSDARSKAHNVTSELKGLTNQQYVALQAQSGLIDFEWTASAEYPTPGLAVSLPGSAPGAQGPAGPPGPVGPTTSGASVVAAVAAGADQTDDTADDIVPTATSIYVELPAGKTGKEDCVCFYDEDAPYKFRVLDDMLRVDVPQSGAVVTGCCTMGAGPISDVFDGGVAGIQRSGAFVGDRVVEEGGSLMVHRTNDKVAGAMVFFIQRI